MTNYSAVWFDLLLCIIESCYRHYRQLSPYKHHVR